MKIKCTYSKLVDINELKENEKNAKLHPYREDLIDRLCKVIEYQGMRKPIVVSSLSGYIVTGHATFRAIKKLGWKQAPIDFQDFDNEDQEIAHLIADNSLTYWREINRSAVNAILPEIGDIDFDIDILGLDGFEIEPADKYDFGSYNKEIESQSDVFEVSFYIGKEHREKFDSIGKVAFEKIILERLKDD